MNNHQIFNGNTQTSEYVNGQKPRFILEALTKSSDNLPVKIEVFSDDNCPHFDIQSALSNLEVTDICSIKTADNEEALATFKTEDGYTFYFNPEDQEWSDGDQAFTNAGLNPVDYVFDEPIAGTLTLSAAG